MPTRNISMARSAAASLLLLVLGACGSEGPGTEAATPPDVPRDDGTGRTEVATEEVSVMNERGPLRGTLTLPAQAAAPAFLIIAGSGPTDRDGNSGAAGQTDTYRWLAAALAERGIASLRYDKEGVGGSASAAPAAEDLRFEMFAEDAALLLTRLREDGRIGSVLVAGHSEGALLGVLAAARVPVDGYASIAGAGRPVADVLREQLGAQLEGALLERANQIIGELERGNTVADVPPELVSVFASVVQPYLISWMRYDPATELAGLAAPALIIQGTTDIQVSVADAERLAAARPDATLEIIEGMSHPLKAASTDLAEQQRAYTDPSLPIMPGVVDALAALAGAVQPQSP